MTVKFTREEMLDILDDEESIVSDEITDKLRWVIVHTLIFKRDGKLYKTYYNVGATENQDEGPWEYDDQVECVEVEAFQKTVTAYRQVV